MASASGVSPRLASASGAPLAGRGVLARQRGERAARADLDEGRVELCLHGAQCRRKTDRLAQMACPVVRVGRVLIGHPGAGQR